MSALTERASVLPAVRMSPRVSAPGRPGKRRCPACWCRRRPRWRACVASNTMGLALEPTPPVVLRVTCPVAAMAAVVSLPVATMPPLPAVRLTLPVPAARAVPLASFRTIEPEPDWSTTMLAQALVASLAAAKVMVQVCDGSPKVMLPEVKIWASSALLMARPVPEVAPTLMGWPG